ncbi:P-loop containing nucleoside triphosphate hydrolase protein [Stipitochalara longipes BDJ]|nr:P-loop containing nucleoside triphosphate hydrolase protein [Stipitochalara longipes BDJ]
MADDPAPSNSLEKEADSKREERVPKFSDYLRVFSYATKWDFCIYIAASAASVGAGVTMPLMNVIFGQLVGQFTDHFKDSSTASSDDFQRILNKQALYIMALFIGRWGLNSTNKFCFRMIGIRLSSAVRLHYLKSLFRQSIQVIDSMPAGAPATAITATSNTLQSGISERLGTFLQSISTICAAFIVSFIWSWNITLVTSSLLLYVLVVLAVALPLIIKGLTASAKADAEGIAIASEALGGIRLVAACGAQSLITSLYGDRVQEAMRRAQKTAPFLGAQLGLLYFGVFGSFGLAFWYGTQRLVSGTISNPGAVLVVILSVMMILMTVQNISTPLLAVSKAMVAACELFTVIDAPQPHSGSLKPDISSEDLLFNDVIFEYPSRPGAIVLGGLNLRIRSGQNTAIVGASGSGKSTVVALLERWYSLNNLYTLPQVVQQTPAGKSKDKSSDPLDEKPEIQAKPILSGSITVGGFCLDDLDLKWWRSQVGLVQQEPFLFNDTIFNNVAHGLIGTQWEDETEERKQELVQESCQEAYAHEFITRLPDGYDTRVGDGGAKLSGGQKQRLAIARSIIKKPRIVILDEATSAIDAKSEKIVQAALDRVSKNRTTITIAHRLSTIQKADHIIVLQNGRVVEEGTHQSLVANASGVYSASVRAQSLHLSDQEELDGPTLVVDDAEFNRTPSISNQVQSTATQMDTKTPRYMIRTFGQLFSDQRAQWPSYLGIIVSSMAVAAGTPIQAWLIAKVINAFLLSGDELKRQGDFWGLMWLALAGGVGIAYFFEGLISFRLQYFVSAEYKLQYLTDLLHQKLGFFDDDSNSHGTLTSRIAGDAKQLDELFGMNLAFSLSGVFIVIGCVTISLVFSWKLGLVALFITMPILLATGIWKMRHERQFEQMNSAVFMESSQFATEAIGAIRTVSALTMESFINKRFQTLLDGHVQAAHRKAQWTAALFGFADSVTLGCQALIIWYGGRLLASGEFSLEAFYVCLMAMIQGAEGAAQVLGLTPDAARAAAAADRILDVQKSAVISQTGPKASSVISNTDGGVEIELRNVSFKYPTRDTLIFNGLSLRIQKGQYVAFVGPSGSGKTSIISLLERFYDLESNHGAIFCNGININNLDVYDYRQHLSLVAQEPTMFRGTVRDNILFGVADPTSISQERIHEVCRDAFIHDFIVSLPEGYNTDVGQKGVAMSGGQKQRIAIARAMIRNPKILLLDEATSALDSESEKIVQSAFERVRNGRTMIAVAHRLSTIQNADVIFVLDDGRVVENGTHNELVKKRGVYWEMCQNQALDQ